MLTLADSPALPDSPWQDRRFVLLTIAAFTATLVPAAALWREYEQFHHHPFSLIEIVTVIIALPWYWTRVWRDRATILRAREGVDPQLITLALFGLYRGLWMASILTALSFAALHFVA